jgi:catechol 2,3-dioxygenase-like lactoylglutathione lyase family enzyme
MDQRVSMITLGVADVPAARSFYERLGWAVTVTDGDIVMFQAGGMIVSLWWRDKLDVDGGVADRGGYGHAALAYAVADADAVDAVCRQAVRQVQASPALRARSPSATRVFSPIRTATPGRWRGFAVGRCTLTALSGCCHRKDLPSGAEGNDQVGVPPGSRHRACDGQARMVHW